MRSKRTKPCPIEGCWEQIGVRRALCAACTNWWYRISLKSTHELASYVRRMTRYSGRLVHLRGRRAKAA